MEYRSNELKYKVISYTKPTCQAWNIIGAGYIELNYKDAKSQGDGTALCTCENLALVLNMIRLCDDVKHFCKALSWKSLWIKVSAEMNTCKYLMQNCYFPCHFLLPAGFFLFLWICIKRRREGKEHRKSVVTSQATLTTSEPQVNNGGLLQVVLKTTIQSTIKRYNR